jgi:hypothetical protein
MIKVRESMKIDHRSDGTAYFHRSPAIIVIWSEILLLLASEGLVAGSIPAGGACLRSSVDRATPCYPSWCRFTASLQVFL